MQAFQLNQASEREVTNLENARGHDIWKTIAFSIAEVGLSTVASFSPPLGPLSATPSPGAGRAAFGGSTTIKSDQESVKKISDYEARLH